MATEKEPEEKVVLDNIHSKEAWEVLKKLIDEQKGNETMPAEIRDVFFCMDAEHIVELSMSENPVIAALASSKMLYDGEALGLGKLCGTDVSGDTKEG